MRSGHISKRIRQALRELVETLNNGHCFPVPARVPVPVRSPRKTLLPPHMPPRRFFSMMTQRPVSILVPQTRHQLRTYSSYYSNFNNYRATRFFRFNNLKLFKFAPNNVLFNNFSTQYQSHFRYKLFQSVNWKPSFTSLFNNRGKASMAPRSILLRARLVLPSASQNAPTTRIRLNISLSPRFHDQVMLLAQFSPMEPEEELGHVAPQPAAGCYVDFTVAPKILIPSATIFNADILNELMSNLETFQKQLADLQADLVKLNELGELPLKFMQLKSVIRVYFPNCDYQKLQSLLVEKDIRNGTIHEDQNSEYLESQGSTASLSDFDLLSSVDMSESVSLVNETVDDEILSSSLSDVEIKRLDDELQPINMGSPIEINDELYWT